MKYIDADLLRKEIEKHIKEVKDAAERFTPNMGFFDAKLSGIYDVMAIIDSLQQEQPDVDLEKFTEKMDAWKSRYNYPDSIPIKGTMAFTARMFYMYPNVAREWYDSLRKVTLD